jgi:hypothetical protein
MVLQVALARAPGPGGAERTVRKGEAKRHFQRIS